MKKRLWGAVALSMLLGLTACGKEPEAETEEVEEPEPVAAEATGEDVLQLKGTGLLAQALYAMLGPGKDLSEERDDDGQPVSLFDLYGSNFGLTKGLRFGEVYADSPSTAYMMSLAIVAENAARLCEEEMLNRDLTLCRCDTVETAEAMLARTYPFADFTTPENNQLARDFQARCSENYRKAVQTAIASIAFALRT